MATRQPGAWGIDIGQCALKALRMEVINGVATATAFDYVEHPKILSQPDADPDLLTREALEKFLSRNTLRGDVVCMSVAGQSGLARFVKLPPVEEKKISDIVRFEAKQQIPFPLEEVVWDYQKIGSGVVTDGFAMETEIGLFAIKREHVFRALAHFQEVDVEVDLIQMAPLALCNFVSYDLLKKDANTVVAEDEGAKKNCVVALDIGVESSSLVITDGERVIWQRPIPIGGNRFTRALTKDLKLTFAKAEHLKRNATKSPDLKRILLALRADLNEFVNEVQKSLAFFINSHRDAHIQYLIGMGNAFRLPGLQKYLNEKLQLEVKKLSKFPRLAGDSVITAPVFNDNVMSMAVVYGLALQGIKKSRLHTNLLPPEIRTDRLVRSKKPWAVAAAAALLLGTGALALGYRMQHDLYAAEVIKKSMQEDGKKALNLAAEENKLYDEKAKKIEELKKSINGIVAGQNERVNWLKLNKFINECLPRPDGKNLVGDHQKAFWTKGGEEAYKNFMAGQSGAKNDAAAPLGDGGLENLIQINLETVNALFTEDLSGYFGRLKAACKELDGMPAEDQKTLPSGSGWVVELRGYTYHDQQRKFIVETLVDNIATKARKAAEVKDGEPPDPIAGKDGKLITHPVLYKFTWMQNAGSAPFELIGGSDLHVLATGQQLGKLKGGKMILLDDQSATAPPAGGKDAPPPPVSRSRKGWKPLGKALDSYTAPEEGAAPKAKVLVGDTKGLPVKEKGQYVRTEFVVLFIWREPTFDEEKPSGPPIPAKPATGAAGAGPAPGGTGQPPPPKTP
jgi:type IV pilus assembly protein PilM